MKRVVLILFLLLTGTGLQSNAQGSGVIRHSPVSPVWPVTAYFWQDSPISVHMTSIPTGAKRGPFNEKSLQQLSPGASHFLAAFFRKKTESRWGVPFQAAIRLHDLDILLRYTPDHGYRERSHFPDRFNWSQSKESTLKPPLKIGKLLAQFVSGIISGILGNVMWEEAFENTKVKGMSVTILRAIS